MLGTSMSTRIITYLKIDNFRDLSMEKSQEQEIRQLVQEEIRSCFEQLSNDVAALKKASKKQGQALARIERAILGDSELQDVGFAKMIVESYDYVRKNKDGKVIERAIPAIEFYETWEKEKKWGELDQTLKDRFVSRRVMAWLNIGSWAGIIGLVLSIGSIITMLKEAGIL